MNRLLLIALALFMATGCSLNTRKEEVKTSTQFCIPDSLMNQITLDTVTNQSVINELKLIGKVTFDQDKVVRIYPLVSGNVSEVKVTLGSRVEKGDVLAVIKSSEMAAAENDLVTARSNLAIAQKNFASSEDMYKSGILSEKEYITAQKELDKAQSELSRASTVHSIYGSGKQSDYVVRAPISGYIVEKFVNASMQIRPDNSTNLFTISDLSTVWVLANVYESDIASIKVNEPVEVTTISYPDKKITGKIDKVYDVLDPDNKTMKVQIQLGNKDNMLKPEMFASVLVREKTEAMHLAVPAGSVVFDRDQYWVVVFKDKCHLEARKITIVTSNSKYTYVSSGINSGEKVVTNRQLLIYNALNQ